jgi:hypothetical protein
LKICGIIKENEKGLRLWAIRKLQAIRLLVLFVEGSISSIFILTQFVAVARSSIITILLGWIEELAKRFALFLM